MTISRDTKHETLTTAKTWQTGQEQRGRASTIHGPGRKDTPSGDTKILAKMLSGLVRRSAPRASAVNIDWCVSVSCLFAFFVRLFVSLVESRGNWMMPAAGDGTETMRMMETTMQVHERPEERKMTTLLPSVIQKTRVRGGGVAVCSMPSVLSDLLNARGNCRSIVGNCTSNECYRLSS